MLVTLAATAQLLTRCLASLLMILTVLLSAIESVVGCF
jgi:hypothetical protein